MSLFDGLGHVALMTRDLAASLDFYCKLGFPEMPDCLQLEAIARLKQAVPAQ